MKAGFASRDITPKPGITLSGFVARCDKPSTGIDDPLEVQALALEQDGKAGLVLVFDLLGLGPELTLRINEKLDQLPAVKQLHPGRALLATHTHSAPATITLLGCGIPDAAYWAQVLEAAGAAAEAALASLQPATFRLAETTLPGGNYNRRRLMSNGKVVMSQHTKSEPVKVGPVWERAVLARFDNLAGKGIAGFIHWAAHPDTVCSQQISADFPGELRRRLSSQQGFPFLFLQGPCGNLNPPFRQMIRAEMLANIDRLMPHFNQLQWSAATAKASPFNMVNMSVPFPYAPSLREAELQAFRSGMAEVAQSGGGSPQAVAVLSDILNVEPGEQADPGQLRHFARIMLEWCDRILKNSQENLPATREVPAALLRCGPLALCFAGVEPFAETALALQAEAGNKLALLIGYASPLAGYLPTAEALSEGGYEADYAYRFYGHPAPFKAEAEKLLINCFLENLSRD